MEFSKNRNFNGKLSIWGAPVLRNLHMAVAENEDPQIAELVEMTRETMSYGTYIKLYSYWVSINQQT